MRLADYDVVILAGGLGTRIKNMLPEGTPKALADINGRPFIRILLSHLRQSGFERFTLCVGYGQDRIVKAVAQDELATFFCENEQFGTGGALRLMMRSPAINLSNPFFLLNGDTICKGIDYQKVLEQSLSDRMAVITALRYNDKNIGTFVVRKSIRATLDWESKKHFNIEDLPIHCFAGIIDVDRPFIDIGTPTGLTMAREIFK